VVVRRRQRKVGSSTTSLASFGIYRLINYGLSARGGRRALSA
jgi:hypothetical protein